MLVSEISQMDDEALMAAHRALDEDVARPRRSGLSDVEVAEAKRKKLRLKDELARRSTEDVGIQ